MLFAYAISCSIEINQVIPMLPAILSEHLCSLNPGVDRLAFSVVFKVDHNGNVSFIISSNIGNMSIY